MLAQTAARQGDCGRCAACCKLLFKCPFLDESGEIATCSIHEKRPDNCRFFPIDPRDLADRDFVDPTNPCGFFFPGTESEKIVKAVHPPGSKATNPLEHRHGQHSHQAMGD